MKNPFMKTATTLLTVTCSLGAMLLIALDASAQTPPAAAPAPTTSATPAAPTAPGATPAAAPEAAVPEAPKPPEEFVMIDGQRKRAIGKLIDLEKGDNGCYITLMNDKGGEIIEVGKFELCARKPIPKGKKVELTYRMENIMASSCYGDPKCKTKEMVTLVVDFRVIE